MAVITYQTLCIFIIIKVSKFETDNIFPLNSYLYFRISDDFSNSVFVNSNCFIWTASSSEICLGKKLKAILQKRWAQDNILLKNEM